MKAIPPEQIRGRMAIENPWWSPPHQVIRLYRDYKAREYLTLFMPLVQESTVRRAIVLMGPRRVGKTVLLHHTIQRLLDAGVQPRRICYVSVDHPLYNGLSLDELVKHYSAAAAVNLRKEHCYVFFDEIQYARDWEIQLKTIVDDLPKTRLIGSGSAAAALRLKSAESGAGRFTDFLLPPLTFHEYLTLLNRTALIEMRSHDTDEEDDDSFHAPNITALNDSFLDYLNYGGYPETLFSEEIRSDMQRYIKNDIVDKVLLRDLPGLYGISDIQELNSLFTTLAYNTADEISLDGLSQNSGVAKNTIKRYIEYLEAAFLVRIVNRIDRSARRFKRANHFKVYLTNPSLRSALFQPVGAEDPIMGALAETAIYSQWFHSTEPLYYARWPKGELDMVRLRQDGVDWAVEVKWSDLYIQHPDKLREIIGFCTENNMRDLLVTTRTLQGSKTVGGCRIEFMPTSLYCYTVGHNLVRGKSTGPIRTRAASNPAPEREASK